MSNPRISVIIPTLNEEKYLPILLHSLKQQTFRDFEVIVADAGSTDKTKEVAEGLGAKLVPGGMLDREETEGQRLQTETSFFSLMRTWFFPILSWKKPMLKWKRR